MSQDKEQKGEGNRAADRRYREKTREFVESGKVTDAAEKARDARESDDKDELERAEEAGKKPARS